MDTQTLLQSWPSFSDDEWGPLNGLPFHKTVGDYSVVSGFNDIFPQMAPPPTIPHTPRFNPPIMPVAPPVTVMQPANLTPLGPVSAPPTIVVDNPTVIFPQPPLR